MLSGRVVVVLVQQGEFVALPVGGLVSVLELLLHLGESCTFEHVWSPLAHECVIKVSW